jgi:hypothetical protein
VAFLRAFEATPDAGPTLLHGACRGADLMAADIVTRCSVPWIIHAYPMPYVAKGKPAGPCRNRLMVNVLLEWERAGYRVAMGAFPLPGSRGTVQCINYAREKGVKVER